MENKNADPARLIQNDQVIRPQTAGDASMDLPTSSDALSQRPTALDRAPVTMAALNETPSLLARLLRWAYVAVPILLLLGLVGLLVGNAAKRSRLTNNSGANVTNQYDIQEIPLNDIAVTETGLSFGPSSVVINGPLTLNDGVVITPSSQPGSPIIGQLYYDDTTNELAYYNGSEFVALTAEDQEVVQSLDGLTGQVGLGNGLAVVGNQLVGAGVLSVGGRSGAIGLGNGLAMSDNLLQNSGVLNVVAGSANVIVTNDGTGTVAVGTTPGGTGTVTSGGGTAGRIAVFTTAQNIENSLLSQSGLTVTANGDLAVTGGLSLGNALTVSNGGTGTTSLAANGVIIGAGTGQLASVTAGGSNLCLLSTAGAPTFAACPGGGGVSSLNGLTGALSVANASGAGSTVTIDTASTTVKGIASFNSTNFTVTGGGEANTVQNINTGASPTFAGVNTNSITPSGALTVGASGQSFILQGTTASAIAASGGGFTTSVGFALPSANQSITFPNASGDVCLTSGNCAGQGGSVGGSGTLNRLSKFTSTGSTIGDSTITDNGSVVTTSADLVIQGGDATIGVASSQTGSLILANSGSAFAGTLRVAALGQATVYTLPDPAGATATICIDTGNCAGSGNGVTTSSPGTAGTLPVFTGTQTVANSLVSQSGSTVTANGNINITSGSQYQVNGTQISSADLSNDADLAKLAASQTFTGNSNAFRNGTNSTNAFSIQNAAGTRVLTTDTSNGEVELGLGSTLDGRLVFNNVSNANTVTIVPGTPTGSRTITLPNDSGTVCLDTGNCAGAGATLQTAYNFSAGGTTPKIKLNNTLLGVDIQDADTTVGANLFNVRESNAGGLGQVMFGVGNTGQVTLQNGANSTTALRLLTDGGTSVLTGDTQNGNIMLGQGGTLGGQLLFSNAANSNLGTLQTATLGQNTTFTLPDPGSASTNICLSSGNCLGGSGSAPNNAAYLTVGNDATLTNERAIAVNTSNLQATDGGANGSYTINTIQDINTTANPTFNNLTLNGTLGVSGGTTLSGDAAINGTNINLGDANTDLLTVTAVLQGANPLVFEGGTVDASELTLAVASLGGDQTITLPDATGIVCLQSASACGFATGSGAAFLQGGNTFGTTATLGTNESQPLDIRTNSTTRMSFGASGGVSIPANSSADELEVGDNVFDINDGNTRINVGNTTNDSFIRLGETSLLFGFLGWANSTNILRAGTFGANDVRLETNTTTRINISGSGRTEVTAVASSGVSGFNVSTTQNATTGLQPANILSATFNPGGSVSASYFGTQSTVDIGAAGTTFTGDIIAHLGQVNWSGASNTSNTGKIIGTVGKVVTAAGAGSIQNAMGLFAQLQYAGGTTVTNSYNVYASNLQSGSTTNLYGFYAENMTGGTNNYPLFLASSTANQPLLSVNGTGATTLQNSTNSAAAFRILNSSSIPGFNVDTTTSNLITNSSIEVDTTGWSASGAAAISRVTSQYYDNDASLQAVTTAASGDGARYSYSLSSSTQYSFSVFVKTNGSASNALEIGRSEDGSTDTSCATNQQTFTRFVRYTCTFTTGTVSGSPYLYIKQIDTTARTMWIDAVQLETGASVTVYRNSKTAFSGSVVINGGSTQAAALNSSLHINMISGGDGIHIVGSGNGNIFQSALSIVTSDGASSIFAVNEASRGTTAQGGNSFFGNAALAAVSTDAGASALEVQGAASQTAVVFKVQNSSDVNMFTIGATGAVLSQNTTNSTTAFRVLNADASDTVFNVDTTNRRVGIGTPAPTSNLHILEETTAGASLAFFRDEPRVASIEILAISNDDPLIRSGTSDTLSFAAANNSTAHLKIDASGNVLVGASDTTGALLILDTKTSSGDPTGVNGAIYYNTGGTGGAGTGGGNFAGKLRCFEGNVWKNCIGIRDMVERRWGMLMPSNLTDTTLDQTGPLQGRAVSGTPTSSNQAESNYIAYATAGTAGSDGGGIGSASGFLDSQTRYLPKLATRIRVDSTSVGASTRYWIGLFESTPMGFDAPTSSAAQTVDYIGVGFRDSVNGGEWLCASGDGTNHSGTDMNVVVTAGHYYDIIVDLSTAGTLVCSVSDNGGAFTTVTKTTNLPGTSTSLGVVEAVRSVTAVARSIFIGYIYQESN